MKTNRLGIWARTAAFAVLFMTAGAAWAATAATEFNFAAVARGANRLFVPAAAVNKARDAGARFLIVDARAPRAFAQAHIKGAVNVPFYEVAKYQAELPKREWIVTYCACPHAEAVAAARALFKLGYRKVKVLDEGFYGWKDAGYPVVTSKP